MRGARTILALVLSLAGGCGLTHEREGTMIEHDAGVPPGDAFVARPDAFVPPNDAWSPPFTIAPHGRAPIVPDQGGPRLAHPELVVVTYADDPGRALHESHLTWLVGSSWLRTVGADYGVGNGSILGLVERPDAAPNDISGAEIEAWIAAGTLDGTLPVPADGIDHALYVLFFPAHTTISDPLVGRSCETHAGYHISASTSDGRTFAYAVIPTCGSFNPALTDDEYQEAAVAHEVIEAATDPQPLTIPAFAFSTETPEWSPWLFAGAEVADLCEYRSGPGAVARESGFVACLVWSNSAAMRNDQDPCVPADVAIPYGGIAISPDTAQLAGPGETVRFDVVGWTTASIPSMGVAAFAAPSGDQSFVADVSLDATSLGNGTHATLAVTVPFGTPSGTYGLVYVQVTRGADSDLVPAVVVVP